MTDSRAVEKKKEVQELNNDLPHDLREKVLSFLVGEDKIKNFKRLERFHNPHSFFFDINVFYVPLAAEATRNLLNRIKVEETLSFIKQNPLILFSSVEVKDIHGQRFSGKPLQVLASAGEFDPIEMKADAKPYGLVPLLRSFFPDPNDFTKQLQERFKPAPRPGLEEKGHEFATRQRMLRVKAAIETLIDDAATSPDISDAVPFKALLNLPIAEKFRQAIKPDPNDVVTLGLAWDVQIFLDFIDMFKASFTRLGGKLSLRSDFVDAVGWGALQRRSSLIDLEVLAKGIVAVVAGGHLPDRFDFSRNAQVLDGIGTTHFFGFNGTRYVPGPRGSAVGRTGWTGRCLFDTYVKQKHKHCTTYAAKESSPESLSNTVAIQRSPAAM